MQNLMMALFLMLSMENEKCLNLKPDCDRSVIKLRSGCIVDNAKISMVRDSRNYRSWWIGAGYRCLGRFSEHEIVKKYVKQLKITDEEVKAVVAEFRFIKGLKHERTK